MLKPFLIEFVHRLIQSSPKLFECKAEKERLPLNVNLVNDKNMTLSWK